MALGKWFLCASLVLAGSTMLIAADEPASPTTQPADTKPARARKLTLPWSLIKSLTPEQTTQIEKVHADAAEEIKKITTKENEDITALLTPAQITELKVAEAKRKEMASKARKEAATQP